MYKYFIIVFQFLLIFNSACMIVDTTTKNPVIRLAAQEYNKKVAFNRVPKDVSHYMFQILLHPHNPIEENIRTSLVLSTVCTQLNDVKYYGKLLEKHDKEVKHAAFIKIIETINDPNYHSKRKPLILLLHSGADPNATLENGDSLLERAVRYNDIPMVELLSNYKTDFNRNSFLDKPLFFYAETPEMANFFVHYGIDLTVSTDSNPNVLWYCCWRYSESEHVKSLVQLYLNKKVALNVRNEREECILHQIGYKPYFGKISDSYKETIKLFLKISPDLRNSLDERKKTPLDVAMENRFCSNDVIELFKQYKCKRAIELQ